jgi:pimeloyl-ACP methyl ester carboxylesterase
VKAVRADGFATLSQGAVRDNERRHVIQVLGQQIRVRVRAGTGVPLVLCNGIGASLELLDPLVEQLHPDTTVVRFDVPGAGASPNSPLPYGIPHLAAVLRRLLDKLSLQRPFDVLGGAVRWHSSSRSKNPAAAGG